MLFENRNGALYQVSQIVQIGPTSKKGDRSVRLSDGTETDISDFEAERISQIGAIFPAAPGTFVLYANGPSPDMLGRSPVVAWALGTDGAVRPITVDGVNDGLEQTLVIQTPDGMVTKAHDQSWASVESFLTDQEPLEE